MSFEGLGGPFSFLRLRSEGKWGKRVVVFKRDSLFSKNGTICSKKDSDALLQMGDTLLFCELQGLSGMTGLSECYLNLLYPRTE